MIHINKRSPLEQILYASRNYLCLPIPEGECATFSPTMMETIAQQISRTLQINIFTHVSQNFGLGQWYFVFFHGKASKQYADAFEGNQPIKVPFTPCQKFVLVMDEPHQRFYVSVKESSLLGFLAALNETLFPTRKRQTPFDTFQIDVSFIRTLGINKRRPINGGLPWSYLALKYVCGYEIGPTLDPQSQNWQSDGFEAITCHAYTLPENIAEIRLACKLLNHDDTFSITLYHETSLMRVSLCPKNFSALAKIIDFSTKNATCRQSAEIGAQLQFVLESEYLQ